MACDLYVAGRTNWTRIGVRRRTYIRRIKLMIPCRWDVFIFRIIIVLLIPGLCIIVFKRISGKSMRMTNSNTVNLQAITTNGNVIANRDNEHKLGTRCETAETIGLIEIRN